MPRSFAFWSRLFILAQIDGVKLIAITLRDIDECFGNRQADIAAIT